MPSRRKAYIFLDENFVTFGQVFEASAVFAGSVTGVFISYYALISEGALKQLH